MALDAARRTPEGTQRAGAAWGRARVKVNAMQAAMSHLGGGWRGDSVREAVESALDAEDITPLVRLWKFGLLHTLHLCHNLRLSFAVGAAAAAQEARGVLHPWTCSARAPA